MKTVGIIGGSSPVATIEYYKMINAGIQHRLGGFSTGEIIICSMNFGESHRFIANNQWEAASVYLNEKAKSLERAGADFIIVAANTLHKILDGIMKDVKLPFLHIVDPTGAEIKKAKLNKVALLGTKPTMAHSFLAERYTRNFEVDVIVPTPGEQDAINSIIFTELSQAIFKPESKLYYLDVIDKLEHQGAQGVILGCTEIPLLIQQSDRPALPMFDSTKLHAEAAVRVMLEQ